MLYKKKIIIFILFGVISAEVFEGLTLITSKPNDNEGDDNVVLINNDGDIINEWITVCDPASIAYLQQDSTLIYPCKVNRSDRLPEGGRIIKYSWNNLILWDYTIPEELGMAHHDIEVLNNGNILVILLETKPYEDAINSGRIDIDGNFSLDYILELEPFGIDGANIIWEWHMWDHLIQDINPDLENFGIISENPQLLDINLGSPNSLENWNHINSIHYNEDLNQIVISSRKQNEFYVIDHSTSIEEASGHSGGDYGKGGDFLYRWGNPANYDKIDYGQFILNSQHSVNWIPENYMGSGNFILFNNDHFDSQSSVLEIEPIINVDGSYGYDDELGFLPITYSWIYEVDGYSNIQSGAFRLPNNNTLITVTTESRIFEIDSLGNILWNYNAETARAIKYSINYLNSNQNGDVNIDEVVNILDILLVVNFILTNEYYELADLNNDENVNVVDVIQLVNIILN